MADQFFLGSHWTNSDVSPLEEGEVVVRDLSVAGGVKRTILANDPKAAGVVVQGGPVGSLVVVASIPGQRVRIRVSPGEGISNGDLLVSSTVSGLATVDNSSGAVGVFAVAVEDKTAGSGEDVGSLLLSLPGTAPVAGENLLPEFEVFLGDGITSAFPLAHPVDLPHRPGVLVFRNGVLARQVASPAVVDEYASTGVSVVFGAPPVLGDRIFIAYWFLSAGSAQPMLPAFDTFLAAGGTQFDLADQVGPSRLDGVLVTRNGLAMELVTTPTTADQYKVDNVGGVTRITFGAAPTVGDRIFASAWRESGLDAALPAFFEEDLGDGAATKFSLGEVVDATLYEGVLARRNGLLGRNVTPAAPTNVDEYRVIEELGTTKVEFGTAPLTGDRLFFTYRA